MYFFDGNNIKKDVYIFSREEFIKAITSWLVYLEKKEEKYYITSLLYWYQKKIVSRLFGTREYIQIRYKKYKFINSLLRVLC